MSPKVKENRKLKTTEDWRESHKRTELPVESMLMERKSWTSQTTTMPSTTDTRKDKLRTGLAKDAISSTKARRKPVKSAQWPKSRASQFATVRIKPNNSSNRCWWTTSNNHRCNSRCTRTTAVCSIHKPNNSWCHRIINNSFPNNSLDNTRIIEWSKVSALIIWATYKYDYNCKTLLRINNFTLTSFFSFSFFLLVYSKFFGQHILSFSFIQVLVYYICLLSFKMGCRFLDTLI